MALDRTEFGPLGGQASRGKAPALYSYKTTDAPTAVDASGYFNSFSNDLEVGDLILRVTVNSSGVPTSAGFHVVMSNASGVVDVSNTAGITGTIVDSD